MSDTFFASNTELITTGLSILAPCGVDLMCRSCFSHALDLASRSLSLVCSRLWSCLVAAARRHLDHVLAQVGRDRLVAVLRCRRARKVQARPGARAFLSRAFSASASVGIHLLSLRDLSSRLSVQDECKRWHPLALPQ